MKDELAKKAYDDWKKSMRVSMQVLTEEEMFKLGFKTAVQLIQEDLVEPMKRKRKS